MYTEKRTLRQGISASSAMAYVPPHRRHSKESERPLLTPELLAPQSKKNLIIKPYNKSNVGWTGDTVYADHSIFRWCAIGLDDENQFPSSVNLEPVSLESADLNFGKNRKEKIVNELVPKIGVDFEEEEDIYEVQLSDCTSPDSTLFCRCRVIKEEGKLELCEIQSNRVRNMVVDISCTTKNLDLSLVLYTRRLATNLTDDKMRSISDLINSAILVPDEKGGLRWPQGKESSGNKYKVVRVWHIIANTYRNSSLRLEVKHTDRFDFRTLTGGASWGTSLVLENVMSKLQEENVEASSISEILKEDMQLIWDNFLSCEPFLTGNCIVNQ
nr:uncharacterized protein LOC103414165 [Malus domestica]